MNCNEKPYFIRQMGAVVLDHSLMVVVRVKGGTESDGTSKFTGVLADWSLHVTTAEGA